MRVFNPFIVRAFKRGAMLVAFGLVLALPMFAFADAIYLRLGRWWFEDTDLLTIIGGLLPRFWELWRDLFDLVHLCWCNWMTAGGDDKKVDKAKKILINAVIGLVITLSHTRSRRLF